MQIVNTDILNCTFLKVLAPSVLAALCNEIKLFIWMAGSIIVDAVSSRMSRLLAQLFTNWKLSEYRYILYKNILNGLIKQF